MVNNTDNINNNYNNSNFRSLALPGFTVVAFFTIDKG